MNFGILYYTFSLLVNEISTDTGKEMDFPHIFPGMYSDAWANLSTTLLPFCYSGFIGTYSTNFCVNRLQLLGHHTVLLFFGKKTFKLELNH